MSGKPNDPRLIGDLEEEIDVLKANPGPRRDATRISKMEHLAEKLKQETATDNDRRAARQSLQDADYRGRSF